MKNKGTHTHIIYGGLFGLLFILVGVALVFALADIDYDALQFSFKNVATFLGIIVSATGLLVTAYFVVLAFNAYSHIRNFENEITIFQNKSREEIESFQRKRNELSDLHKNYVNSIFDNYNFLTAFINSFPKLSKTNLKLRNDLILSQTRFSYRYPTLDKETRMDLLRELGDIGELEDINYLKLLTLNPNEDQEIKDRALFVINHLRERFRTP